MTGTTTNPYNFQLAAAAARVRLKDSLEDETLAVKRQVEAEEAHQDVSQRLGLGSVDADELIRVRANLEIAIAQSERASHQVRLNRASLLNESTDIASMFVARVAALPLVTGRSVAVLPFTPTPDKFTLQGKLPAAAVSQSRASISHPSGYVYTHASTYNGPRAVAVHVWTTGLHRMPLAHEIEKIARDSQVNLGGSAGHERVEISERKWAEGVVLTSYEMRIFSAWPEVPVVDLTSPWFDPAQGLDLPVRRVLEVTGQPSSVTHASCHSRIVSSTETKNGVRFTEMEVQVRGASASYSPSVVAETLQRLVSDQVDRAHPWVGRCTSVDINRTSAVTAQGVDLEPGRPVGEPAGAMVSATLTFTSSLPAAVR